MKILNFGSCNIDYVYMMDHIVAPGETLAAKSLEIFPGGKGLNQSIAAARAGAQVYHAGCIGYDGELLLDIMRQSGVNVSFVQVRENKSGHAVIQVSAEGENSIFVFPGANETITEAYIDSVLEAFNAGDILMLQNEINNVDLIAEKAFAKNMYIMLNPSPINEKINKIDLRHISCLIVNEIEAKTISGCENIEDGLAVLQTLYPELKIVLTLGKRGSMYLDGEQKLYQPAFLVDVVDTTAAGDTFAGYFAASVTDKKSCAESLKLASAAAAIAVSKMGAAPSVPTMQEVLEKLDRMQESEER